MKIRILSLACVMTAAALLAACTAVYKNSDACERLMRSKLAEKSSDTLKIANRGVGIDGSRVVVEGSIEHVPTASEVAAVAASSVGAGSAASAVSAGGASGVSGADALSLKPAKPKKVVQPAAAECTFHGSTLNAFNWLAPARLAASADENHGEAAQ